MPRLVPFTLVVICSTSCHELNAAIRLGPVFNPQTGNIYYVLEADTWTNSQDEAVSLGGNLVTINDQAENDWVTSTFRHPVWSNVLWLGLNDVASEGEFVWVSGEPVTFTNWALSEPNSNGNEDYVQSHNGNGIWNDVDNDGIGQSLSSGVVEVIVPEPSSLWLFGITLLSLAALPRLAPTVARN